MPKKAKDTLRPYQAALIPEIMSALDQHGSVVLQLPTGGGKTHIATEIARRARSYGKTVWFVCHRREIRKQTSDAFTIAGLEHGVVKAGTKIAERHDIWVCSVDALARRLAQMDPPDIIIWDEAHHIVARTWAALKDRFGDAHHLGLTATPDRLDGTGLKESFNHLICGPDTRSLIEQGYLSTYRLFGPTIPDMRGVKTKMGDYDKGDVEKEMTKPVLVGDVVDHYKRLAPGARAIAFAISVKASLAVVERFRAAGIPAEHVDAKTAPEARDAAVAALKAGAIKVLSNVEIFTEGFDLPAIDAVILLRPTKSLALYRQMIGRGLRAALGKAATVILDHSGLVHEHGLPDDEIDWTLEGYSRPPEPKDGEGKPRLRICPECFAIHPWAAECVECQHVYAPEDRTIEEVYGELISHSRDENFESNAAFARRYGVTPIAVLGWRKKGMPYDADRGVPYAAAAAWIKEGGLGRTAISSDTLGYETVYKFSRRIDVSEYALRNSIKKGLPVDARGFVLVKEATQWLEENPIRRSFRKNNSGESETFENFAKTVGITSATLRKYLNKDFPRRKDGRVDVNMGNEWCKNYVPFSIPARLENKKRIKLKGLSEASGETYARLHGLIKQGLPVLEGSWIDVDDAITWIESYKTRMMAKYGNSKRKSEFDYDIDKMKLFASKLT